MIDFLLNPWVITLLVIFVFVGNIAALKQTANTVKFGEKRPKSELDKLNELDKARHGEPAAQPGSAQDPASEDKRSHRDKVQ